MTFSHRFSFFNTSMDSDRSVYKPRWRANRRRNAGAVTQRLATHPAAPSRYPTFLRCFCLQAFVFLLHVASSALLFCTFWLYVLATHLGYTSWLHILAELLVAQLAATRFGNGAQAKEEIENMTQIASALLETRSRLYQRKFCNQVTKY